MNRSNRSGTKYYGSIGLALTAACFAQAAFAQDALPSADESTALYEDQPASGGSVRVAPPSGGVHVIQEGETLWSLAERYTGNGESWSRIWSYNPEITNPHWIYPGTRVRLTGADGATPAQATSGVASRVRFSQAARVVRATSSTSAVTIRDQAFLDKEALEQSGELVASEMDHMFFVPFEEAYVQFNDDQDSPVRVGQELTLYREMQSRERNDDEEGELVRVFGTARVLSYDAEHKKARVVMVEVMDTVERGIRVATLPRRFVSAPPRRNEQDGNGRIIASSRPTRVIGDNQLVFVNLGAEEGVSVGNRLFVTTTVDRWESSRGDVIDPGNDINVSEGTDTELPPQAIAELRVVSVSPHSCAVLVTRSAHEFAIGATVVMRAGY